MKRLIVLKQLKHKALFNKTIEYHVILAKRTAVGHGHLKCSETVLKQHLLLALQQLLSTDLDV